MDLDYVANTNEKETSPCIQAISVNKASNDDEIVDYHDETDSEKKVSSVKTLNGSNDLVSVEACKVNGNSSPETTENSESTEVEPSVAEPIDGVSCDKSSVDKSLPVEDPKEVSRVVDAGPTHSEESSIMLEGSKVTCLFDSHHERETSENDVASENSTNDEQVISEVAKDVGVTSKDGKIVQEPKLDDKQVSSVVEKEDTVVASSKNEGNDQDPKGVTDAKQETISQAKKRKLSAAMSPARVQPKRSASSKISFTEPDEYEDEVEYEDIPKTSFTIGKNDSDVKSLSVAGEKNSPKVTVIELGNSSLKLSEILRGEKKSADETKKFSTSSITISKTNSPSYQEQVPRSLSTLLLNSNSASKSQLRNRLQMGSGINLQAKNSKPMGKKKIKIRMSANSKPNILNNVSILKKAMEVKPQEKPLSPPAPPQIDEKAEYDKLEWENEKMFEFIRPGRFIAPSPNETISFSVCNERLVECASKVTPFLLKYPVIPKVEGYKFEKKTDEEPSVPLTQRSISFVTDSYFKSSLGNFFVDIGQRLVSEWVQKDLVRSRKRKMEKEGETEASAKSLEAMLNMYEQLKAMNSKFHFNLFECSGCNFKTESSIVLKNHYETPHVFPGTYKYSCTYCDFDVRDISLIVRHMATDHSVRAKIEPINNFHECSLCYYSTDKKQRMYNHASKCNKNFRINFNLLPSTDFSFPAKSFPPTWMHTQNVRPVPGLMNIGPFSTQVRPQPQMSSKTMISNLVPRMRATIPANSMARRPATLPPSTLVIKQPQLVSYVVQDEKNKLYKTCKPLKSATMSVQYASNQSRINKSSSKTSPITIISNKSSESHPENKLASTQKPSITLTPVNHASANENKEPKKISLNGLQSVTVPFKGSKRAHTFVICEICDGYIRDLEQLRAHMQWMHKVKIHQKMIHNRPPLNCQKCQFRFFTDQGLERHLLGIHGLVTSNMQSSANRGEDAGRCSACGKLFQSKLLQHIAKVHKIMLKPAHLSYKCTVCSATFTLYKLFESHVYSKHTVQSNGSNRNAPEKRVASPVGPARHSSTGPVISKTQSLADKDDDECEPPPAKLQQLTPTCPECNETVSDIEKHWKDRHQRPFSIKLCHIEQCHKCLSEFDGFVVIHTELFESDEE